MEQVEIQYVNEYKREESMGGLAFVVLITLGFLVAVGALCFVLWVIA